MPITGNGLSATANAAGNAAPIDWSGGTSVPPCSHASRSDALPDRTVPDGDAGVVM